MANLWYIDPGLCNGRARARRADRRGLELRVYADSVKDRDGEQVALCVAQARLPSYRLSYTPLRRRGRISPKPSSPVPKRASDAGSGTVSNTKLSALAPLPHVQV